MKHFLEQCLYSVYRALQDIEAEVFVVDNNSVDGSVGLIKEKFPKVRLVINRTNKGFSAANNQALLQASGKYVLLLNPDTVVQEDTFSKTLAFMEAHPEAGGLGIKMVDGKGNFLPESKRGLPKPEVAFYKIFGLAKLFPGSSKFGQYHLTYLDNQKNHEVDVLSGAFMLIRKTCLDKAGLLDETFFMYGEDIDLSYRITKSGYKNYYFAESSIIHYKGESTKKSSVNYVLVFYRAMAIFARKHFSQGRARMFSLLIYLAIALRAGLAILSRLFSRMFFPVVDFALLVSGLYLCKTVYENYFKLYPNLYAPELIAVFFPLYAILWMLFVYLSGGYDTPLQFRRVVRGILAGTAFILIAYSLLPENYRFSRALILIGTVLALGVYLLTRRAYAALGVPRFSRIGGKNKIRIAIIGSEIEFKRVLDLLEKSNINPEFVGFISNENNGMKNTYYIGNMDQLDETISIHNIREIIFCARDVPSSDIIGKMLNLVTRGVEFKIAPPESLSIIGSNSIDTAGELYVIDMNNLGRPENRRKKRIVDLTLSLTLLLFSPILIWFQHNKSRYLINCLLVLVGYRTWVGYGKDERVDLPEIRASVFGPADGLVKKPEAEQLNRMMLNYSKDYRSENDLSILLRNWKNLGT